jgi:hypothetical protein
MTGRREAIPGTCKRPPAGWFCTLEDGHDGPCPTWPRRPFEPITFDPVSIGHSAVSLFIDGELVDNLITYPGGFVPDFDVSKMTAAVAAPVTASFKTSFNFADIEEAVRKLDQSARVNVPDPFEPKVELRGSSTPAITLKPYRVEITGLSINWHGYPPAASNAVNVFTGSYLVSLQFRVIDRDDPTRFRELFVSQVLPISFTDKTENIRAELAAIAFNLMSGVILHELKETFFVDGKHYRDPEPEHAETRIKP